MRALFVVVSARAVFFARAHPRRQPPSQMSQAPIPDADVQRELGAIEQRPVTEDERKNACRAIMRFKGRRGPDNAEEDLQSPIEVTEDWVRLYVALRRASGSPSVRFSANHLRRWRARVAIHDCEAESFHNQKGGSG